MSTLTGTCHCGGAHWEMDGEIDSVTACNCTLCRRLVENERIRLFGATASYARVDVKDPVLEIVFCPTCACVLAWRALKLSPDGRKRMAVNIRLAPPERVTHLPIDHFDGLNTFEDLPRDGRCVRDLWF